MTKQAYLQQDGMFMKLSMARASSQHVCINYNNLGKIEYHANILPETFYSKSRARLRHARALHNCKQGHGWIENNYIYKTSLLYILKISIDLTVGTWIHGNKLTAGKRLGKIPSPWKQKHHEAQFAYLFQSPHRLQKYMAYTSVKMAWHRSKDMQSSCS